MRVLIVGNNVAGTNLARNLREANPDIEIRMFTDESRPYYPRPKLIEYVAGEIGKEEMPFYPSDWYEKNRIDLRTRSRIEKIDRKAKKVLANGEWHEYDALVLANGASAFVPPFKGLPKKGVFSLRTIDDADMVRDTAARSKSVVIIGGGLLGLEAARALAKGFPGLKITILEYAEHLLMRQLDHEGASILQGWIEKRGTIVQTRSETEEIMGDSAATGVKLKDGRVIQCDMVLVSAGARPNLSLAKEAGLDVNRGVVIDSYLKTSDENIYAIGDVAEFGGKTWGIIPPALEQARIAAKNILGQEMAEYKGTVPSNTLKVMGIDFTSVGMVRSEHEPAETTYEEIMAATPDGSVYRKFVLKDGKLVGAILLGTKKDVGKVTKMVKEGASVESFKEKLSDPGFSFP